MPTTDKPFDFQKWTVWDEQTRRRKLKDKVPEDVRLEFEEHLAATDNGSAYEVPVDETTLKDIFDGFEAGDENADE